MLQDGCLNSVIQGRIVKTYENERDTSTQKHDSQRPGIRNCLECSGSTVREVSRSILHTGGRVERDRIVGFIPTINPSKAQRRLCL
jgi:hypothetical protein